MGAKRALLLFVGALFVATGTFYAQRSEMDEGRDVAPAGKGIGTIFSHGQQSNRFGPQRFNLLQPALPGNGIYYHGGPLILNTTNVYFIWYGNWTSYTGATTLLPILAQHIGGTPYFNINTTYYNASGTRVSNSVNYNGAANDNYSQGQNIDDNGVQAIVARAINLRLLPRDTNGVYFVLTSPDVNETTGFCTHYCGWHDYGYINGSSIKYAFVGGPARCPSACAEQWNPTPNNAPQGDAMASILAHELEESVTDPELDAWYDTRGEENADKCAWTFGTTYRVANGAIANMNFGGRDWLIQRNWVNANGGYCSKSY